MAPIRSPLSETAGLDGCASSDDIRTMDIVLLPKAFQRFVSWMNLVGGCRMASDGVRGACGMACVTRLAIGGMLAVSFVHASGYELFMAPPSSLFSRAHACGKRSLSHHPALRGDTTSIPKRKGARRAHIKRICSAFSLHLVRAPRWRRMIEMPSKCARRCSGSWPQTAIIAIVGCSGSESRVSQLMMYDSYCGRHVSRPRWGVTSGGTLEETGGRG